jgi:hypothetical protein
MKGAPKLSYENASQHLMRLSVGGKKIAIAVIIVKIGRNVKRN